MLPLRSKLLVIVILAIAPALALMIYSGFEERDLDYEEAAREATNYTRLVAAEYEASTRLSRLRLEHLARMPEVRDYESAGCNRFLAEFHSQRPEYANIGVTDAAGNLRCSALPTRASVNFADRAWFIETTKTHAFTAGDYVLGRLSNKVVNVFSLPLPGRLAKPGVVFISHDLRWVAELAERIRMPQGTHISVLSADGAVLFRYPQPENWIGRNVIDSAVGQALSRQAQGGTLRAPGYDGTSRISAYLPLNPDSASVRSFVVVDIPAAAIDAELLARTARNVAATALALALALVIAWRFGKHLIERPVAELVATKRLVDSRNALLREVSELQASFIEEADSRTAFSRLIEHVVRMTGSEYGLVGVIRSDGEGGRFLHVLAMSGDLFADAAWRPPHMQSGSGELEFRNPRSLLGAVFHGGETVISNEPAAEPRSSGLPPGHPPLHAFLGLPLSHGGVQVGMIGLANRAGGYDAALAATLQPLLDTAATLIKAFRSEQRRREAEAALVRLNDELDERVLQRTAELQASLSELESFSYSVSHDLRGPLRGISGFSQILAEDYGDRLDEEGLSHLKRISDAAIRMGELIDDLIELARLSRLPRHDEDVDLSAMARELAAELQRADPRRKAEFVIAEGLVARCDETLMHAALRNFLGNAWKYTAKCPVARIEFGRYERDGKTVYFVRDNGAGFDMNFSDKLFKPFQRLHKPGEYEGSGIGLATAHRIISRHGGEVCAEGEPGKGAAFYFTLG